VVELLPANKAEVNARDTFGITPLRVAADTSDLVNKHAVMAKEDKSVTPLPMDIAVKFQAFVELLRQHGGRE
jgi:hypothetical protein